MSIQSQENHMRKLARLLSNDLGYIWGERESGPNGDKKVFLNTGRAFLRALAQDLHFRDAKVSSNAGGIAVSGECYLTGMWEGGGLHICLEQPCFMRENVLRYHSVRTMQDYKGGYHYYIRRSELETMSYQQLLARLGELHKECVNEWAA